jgi:hypothetical protein
VATSSNFFRPHPNLSDDVNGNIVRSEVEGGVFLQDLPLESGVQIQTRHHWYTLVRCADGGELISGHPEFCPRPVRVRVQGSTWGGSMLKLRFVGRGMQLEFCHPAYATPIVTSPIVEIRQCDPAFRSGVLAELPA